MPDCPCCSGNLLRHVRPSGVYWYCLDCRREMPNLGECSYSPRQYPYQAIAAQSRLPFQPS